MKSPVGWIGCHTDDGKVLVNAAELDSLRDNLGKAADLLLIWQSWLGASRNQCDELGKALWDRIEAIAQDGTK